MKWKHLVEGVAGLLAYPGFHLYAALPQYLQALARHQGIGVIGATTTRVIPASKMAGCRGAGGLVTAGSKVT